MLPLLAPAGKAERGVMMMSLAHSDERLTHSQMKDARHLLKYRNCMSIFILRGAKFAWY